MRVPVAPGPIRLPEGGAHCVPDLLVRDPSPDLLIEVLVLSVLDYSGGLVVT